ncbi:MAG: nitroreductase family protein [Ilumatobacteraceae bacterium]
MRHDLDVGVADRLLTTTRSVRRRLDLAGQVPDDVVRTCLDIAQQAPSGSNSSSARWIVVRDPAPRRQLADIYRLGLGEYARATAALEQRGFEGRVDTDLDGERTRARDAQTKRVFASARHLTEHLHEVPVLVVPCLLGRLPDAYDNFRAAAFYGSIHPAIWSFMLALRVRGYGSVYTSLHLVQEREAAEVLGIPDHVTQAGLVPVAPFLGEGFRAADRGPIDEIIAVDRWDF